MIDIEAQLTDAFNRRAGGIDAAPGRIDDVYRRAERSHATRRKVVAVASVALVAAAAGGLIALGQRGDGVAAPGAPSEAHLGYWFVCGPEVALADGTTAYDDCSIDTEADDPVWQCDEPAQDAHFDDRRLTGCRVVDDAIVPDGRDAPATTAGNPAVTTPPTATAAGDPAVATPPTTGLAVEFTADPLAIGDSVMLSAADVLRERGYYVDASVSRQFVEMVPIVAELHAAGRLGNVVILHLGNHGQIAADDLATILDELADVPNVILLTSNIDRDWIATNNELIRAADAEPNVIVIDWATRAADCPGDCFAADGYHLTADGARFYADLLQDVTGT